MLGYVRSWAGRSASPSAWQLIVPTQAFPWFESEGLRDRAIAHNGSLEKRVLPVGRGVGCPFRALTSRHAVMD